MATRCNFTPHFTSRTCPRKPTTPFSFTHFSSPKMNQVSIYPNLDLSKLRLNRGVSAVFSEESALESGYSGTSVFRLTYLELEDFPEIDCLLITQSLDDHCRLRTLKPLSQKLPSLKLLLLPMLKHCWISSSAIKSFLEKEQADIVITPVIKQLLPKFTLVSGQEDACQLAKLLNARYIVPMKNGDLDSKGLLASIVQSEGTIESFKEIFLKKLPDAKVLEPTPGLPLPLHIPESVILSFI